MTPTNMDPSIWLGSTASSPTMLLLKYSTQNHQAERAKKQREEAHAKSSTEATTKAPAAQKGGPESTTTTPAALKKAGKPTSKNTQVATPHAAGSSKITRAGIESMIVHPCSPLATELLANERKQRQHPIKLATVYNHWFSGRPLCRAPWQNPVGPFVPQFPFYLPDDSPEVDMMLYLQLGISNAKRELEKPIPENVQKICRLMSGENNIMNFGLHLDALVKTGAAPKDQWAQLKQDWAKLTCSFMSREAKRLLESGEASLEGMSEWRRAQLVSEEEFVEGLILEKVSQFSPERKKAFVDGHNADWPWENCPPQLLLEAPFAFNRYESRNAKKKEFNQDCKLFTLPHEVQRRIYGYVFEYHTDAAAFVSTCQSAFNQVAMVADHWDMSRGDFREADTRLDDPNKFGQAPGKIIIVSPYRLRQPVTAGQHMDYLHRMTFCFFNWAEKFENVLLHRVPLLTVEVLDHVVPYMRNLKLLGVYRCPLIHFGHTLSLLEMVGKAHRIETHKAPAKLDFSPRFHVGPKEENARTGSYGVTWKSSGLDTRLAIWCLVERAIKMAKEQGIPECIMSKQSAFRLFVEQLCWQVGPTMDAIYNDTYADDPHQLAALVDFPITEGLKKKLPHKCRFWGEYFQCKTCEEQVLGIFYTYNDNMKHNPKQKRREQTECLGCQLIHYLDRETDHLKFEEERPVGRWLRGADGSPFGNTEDTARALDPARRKESVEYAESKLEPERQRFREQFDRARACWAGTNLEDADRFNYYRLFFGQEEHPPGHKSSPRTTDLKVHTGPVEVEPGESEW